MGICDGTHIKRINTVVVVKRHKLSSKSVAGRATIHLAVDAGNPVNFILSRWRPTMLRWHLVVDRFKPETDGVLPIKAMIYGHI
jgi:hypothetical protein